MTPIRPLREFLIELKLPQKRRLRAFFGKKGIELYLFLWLIPALKQISLVPNAPKQAPGQTPP